MRQHPKKDCPVSAEARVPWTSPVARKISLNENALAKIRTSRDPIGTLKEVLLARPH